MRYSCDTCGKSYKHKRNLKRHIKDRHSQNEHWNCPEIDCKTKFIRREYLSRHLVWKHGYSQPDAREAAITASRGDQPVQHDSIEDVSEDDSILDLLDQREVNVHEFYEKVNDFDTTVFDQGSTETVNEIDISLNGDVDVELLESVHEDVSGDVSGQVCDDLDNDQTGSNDFSGAVGCNDETSSVNGVSNDGYAENRVEDEESLDDVENNVSDHDDESVIVISSDDDDMDDTDDVLNDDRTVEVSNSTTVIQTFVLTVYNVCRYVNGNLVESRITMDRDYYRYTDQ